LAEPDRQVAESQAARPAPNLGRLIGRCVPQIGSRRYPSFNH
jgi:hypothetical protein